MGIASPVERHGSRLLVRTFFGAKMFVDMADIIDQRIYYFGLWEPNLTAYIGRALQLGDVFVDVGANTGFFSLWAASLIGPNGHTVAIEASPLTFQILSDNLKANGSTNVRAVNIAASDHAGILKVFQGSKTNRGTASVLGGDSSSIAREVEAAPVDEILEAGEFRRVRLVKIDVEGAEWLVVCGLTRLLSNGRSDLEVILEVAPDCLEKMGHSADELIELFRDFGFQAYTMRNDYSFMSYVPPRSISPLLALRGSPSVQTEVVFSRSDPNRPG
jgi:FkbM family methyltransferase